MAELEKKWKEDESDLTFKPKITKTTKKGEEEDQSAAKKSMRSFIKNSLVSKKEKYEKYQMEKDKL